MEWHHCCLAHFLPKEAEKGTCIFHVMTSSWCTADMRCTYYPDSDCTPAMKQLDKVLHCSIMIEILCLTCTEGYCTQLEHRTTSAGWRNIVVGRTYSLFSRCNTVEYTILLCDISMDLIQIIVVISKINCLLLTNNTHAQGNKSLDLNCLQMS